MKKLILKNVRDRWVDQETGHHNYGLDNAMAEVFHRTGNRNFLVEGDLVFLVLNAQVNHNGKPVANHCMECDTLTLHPVCKVCEVESSKEGAYHGCNEVL